MSASALADNTALKYSLPDSEIFITAGFLRRIIAAIIDYFAVFIVIYSPFFISLADLLESNSTDNMTLSERHQYYLNIILSDKSLMIKIYLVLFISIVLSLLYFAFTEYMFGQTLGKAVLGIAVVDSSIRYISLSSAVIRNITKSLMIFISTPVAIPLLFDFTYVFFNGKGQRLSEKWANSIVVYKHVLDSISEKSEKEGQNPIYVEFKEEPDNINMGLSREKI